MAFQRLLAERFSQGSSFMVPPDLLPLTAWRLLKNSRLTRIVGALSSRAGISAVSAALGGTIHKLWTLFGVSGNTRYAQVGSGLYRLSAAWATPTLLATASTTPISVTNMVDGNETIQAYFTSEALGQYKDDGTTWTTWGIAPPTGAPSAVALATDLSTTIDAMDAAANWTVTSGLSAGPTDETNIKQQGTGSVTITVAASTLGHIARSLGATTNLDTLTGGDATVKADDYIHLWVRVDRPERVSYLQIDFDLDTTTVANAFRTNYYSIRLAGLSTLNLGRDQWTKIQVPKSQFQRFGSSTSLDWADVECVRLSVLTTGEGAAQLYFDDFKLRGGTDIMGSVRYAICYRNDNTKARGNPYLDSDEQVVYTTALDVDRQRTSITISNVVSGGANHPGDAQITHIRLYRSIDEGDALQIDEFVDTTASPYVDDVSVVSTLLSRVLEADNMVPPDARVVFGPGTQNRLFLLYGQNDLAFSKSWSSDDNRAENCPSTFRTKIGDGAEMAYAGIATNTTILVWTDIRTYSIQGVGADTYLALPIPDSRGIVGSQAVTQGDGYVFFVSQDGIYLQQGLRQDRITDMIASFFKGITVAGQPGWNTAATATALTELQWHSDPIAPFLLMLYCEAGSSALNRALYLGKNPATGRYEQLSFDTHGEQLTCLHTDHEANTLFAGCTAGLVLHMEDEDVATDNGTAFDWEAIGPSSTHGRPDAEASVSQVFAEGNTHGTPITITALYDKQATSEALTTAFTTTTDTAMRQYPTADPVAIHRDMALSFSGTATTRIDLYRYGWQYELQPEPMHYWESGLVDFGYQTVLNGIWYVVSATADITVGIQMDQQAPILYTIIQTGGLRQADRFFVEAGMRGREIRVSLTSDEAFRLYSCHAKVKPYGTGAGARDVPLMAG